MSAVSTTARCGAKTKSGEPCKSYVMHGSNRCKRHSNGAPPGYRHGNFRGRDRSKYLPARMLDSVEEALSDPDLTSLRQDLITVDARVDDLIKRDESGESGEAWRRLQEIDSEVRRLKRLGGRENEEEAEYLQDSMSGIIADGLEGYNIWQDIESLIDLRRKLSESERRRMVLLDQYTPNSRVITLLQVVLGVIREETRNDPETLRRISARVGKFINIPASAVAPQHGPRR